MHLTALIELRSLTWQMVNAVSTMTMSEQIALLGNNDDDDKGSDGECSLEPFHICQAHSIR